MKTDSAVTASSTSAADSSGDLKAFVFVLFFVFGGITSLNDVIIPKLKLLFTLRTARPCWSSRPSSRPTSSSRCPRLAGQAHRLHALGGSRTVHHDGGVPAVRAGLDPRNSRRFFALFVLAAGITTVQVVANPLISMLGAPATASSRLTFAQAFNSLGTTVSPMSDPSSSSARLRLLTPRRSAGVRSMSFVDRDPGDGGYLSALALRSRYLRCASGSAARPRGDSCGTGARAALLRPADAIPLRLWRVVHLPVRGRGGGDRLVHRDLSDAR